MSHDAKCKECGTFLEPTPPGFACPKMCGRIWPRGLANELARNQFLAAEKVDGVKKSRYAVSGHDGLFQKCRKRAGCIRAWIGDKRYWLVRAAESEQAVSA